MGSIWMTVACFGCLLAGVLGGVLLAAWSRNAKATHVYKLLRWHFGATHLNTLVVTERQFPARIRVDLQRSLDHVIQERATVEYLTGIKYEDAMMFGISLSDLLVYDTKAMSVPLGHEEVDIGESEPVRCLKNALWLLKVGDSKVAILLSQVFCFNEPPRVRIDVSAENNATGQEFSETLFKTLEDGVAKAESYRGKVLSLEDAEEYTGESVGITVHQLPPVSREEVILPKTTLELLERNVLQFVGQRRTLMKLGQSAKKGLLFFGPPGNGKTHTIRYLISELQGHTTLLIAAEQAAKLAEYMTLARLLQPALVVLEDVDLFARERTQAGSSCQETLLYKLLNEMDGLREDAEIVFVLTTNRPDSLEEALASRPGRIDQVIEFPFPDEEGRGKLVELYSSAMSVPDDLMRWIVQRTEGVSAAFVKELMRRSLQFHLAEGNSKAIEEIDVKKALDEMLILGGRLNQRTLGFGSGSQTPDDSARCESC
jgi:hypothetical protein